MSEEKHTPIPWQMHDEDYCPEEIWGDLDGPDDGRLRGTLVCTVETDDPFANAAYIVRACNSHPALVEAAKAALDELFDLGCDAATAYERGSTSQKRRADTRAKEIHDQLSTAIRAAQGE